MAELWEQTAEMFGSLFTNPKMSKKLLMRPPFKYLLHIIIKTMRNIDGFCKGLYTEEELDFDYYKKNKMWKLVFLQKWIDITEAMNETAYGITPKEIAGGKSCDKTNLLLQGFYQAGISGNES